MGSVLIKGMDIPKNCAECFINSRCDVSLIAAADATLVDAMRARAGGCPLIEVPVPHGDLIDRTVIKQSLGDAHFKNYGEATIIVMDAPTVIAAEE